MKRLSTPGQNALNRPLSENSNSSAKLLASASLTRLLLVLTLPILVLVQACASRANEKTATPIAASAVAPAVPVDGHLVRPAVFSETIEITGSLAANQEVVIASELLRKVVRVHVKEGNSVQAGTLLFQLDDADLQAQLQRLHQQEKLAALNEARMKDLIEHDAAIQQDYDQAITNLKVLEAEIRQLQTTIDKTRIRAPFSGRVGIIRTYPGALVSPTTILTSLVDDGRIKVEFAVPEKYANLVSIGNAQIFTVESDTTKYNAVIVAKESSMDQQTRTLLVRAVSNNPHNTLVPGQSARLILALRTATNALQIPSQALIPSSQGYTVFVAKNNIAQPVPVEIGQRGPYDVQINKGLLADDTVITSNLLRLMPGAAVQFVTIK